MSRLPVRLHPEALEEAQAAVEWYDARSPRAAARFLEELGLAVEAIRSAPDRWPAFDGPTHRLLLRHFPYFVVYRLCPGAVEILAVAHGRRRPGYWRDRNSA